VSHETIAKKSSETVYTFSFTTLWFHTVKAVAPMSVAAPAPTSRCHRSRSHPTRTRSVIRNQAAAESAEQSAASTFTRCATVGAMGRWVKTLPSSTKNGLPGGCGIPSTYAAAMYSLASHIAVDGARVSRYSPNTTAAAMPAARYEGR
jgi:hypothetical protein